MNFIQLIKKLKFILYIIKIRNPQQQKQYHLISNKIKKKIKKKIIVLEKKLKKLFSILIKFLDIFEPNIINCIK